jgi:hypothetical protein
MPHAAASLLALALGSTAPCELEIATVAEFRGTWKDRGVTLGQRSIVCRESVVERIKDSRSTSTDFIKLVSRSGQHTVVCECRALLGCEKPLDLSALVRDEERKLRGASLFDSIVALFAVRSGSTLSRDPPGAGRRADPAAAREWRISRAAVTLSGSPIRSDTTFGHETPGGVYLVYLCPSPAGDASCGISSSAGRKFTWQPASSADLPVGTPASGTFLLYRVRADDVGRKNPGRTLIIVVDRTRAAANPDLIAEARDKIALAAQSELARTGDTFERYVRFIAISLIAPSTR